MYIWNVCACVLCARVEAAKLKEKNFYKDVLVKFKVRTNNFSSSFFLLLLEDCKWIIEGTRYFVQPPIFRYSIDGARLSCLQFHCDTTRTGRYEVYLWTGAKLPYSSPPGTCSWAAFGPDFTRRLNKQNLSRHVYHAVFRLNSLYLFFFPFF